MRVLFLGTGDIGLPTLKWLLSSSHQVVGVVTQPDKPVGRHQELHVSEIKQTAIRAGIMVFQPERIREPGIVEQLRGCAPDVVVVMAYGQILPRPILDLPSRACLNLHASLLPRFRGASPIQAAIEAGDAFSGITVMYMAEGLDTGDVLLEKSVPLRRRETGGSLHDRLALLAPEALAEALELLERGMAPRFAQDATLATYAGKLTREHGVIQWDSPQGVDRRVRAMNPWPGAFTWLPLSGGIKKLKVFSVIQSRRSSGGTPPGTVLQAEPRGILVSAGPLSVWLTEVQLEGKRRMRASEFLRGNPLEPGIALGKHSLP